MQQQQWVASCSHEERASCIKVHPDTNNPTGLWESLCRNVRCNKIDNPLPLDTPVQADCIRVVCLSDTHNQLTRMLGQIPQGDLLIHAGDFTMGGTLQEVEHFCQQLQQLPHSHKVIIAGNHDICLDKTTALKGQYSYISANSLKRKTSQAAQLAWAARQRLSQVGKYLEDSGCSIYGYNIWGSPWTPTYVIDSWAFQMERGEGLLDMWNRIPDDTDILVSHGPPLGFGDCTHHDMRAGCVELLNTIQQRVRPRYNVFGHIHEAYGTYTDGETLYINAANCGLGWRIKHEPIIFDLPLPEGVEK